MSRIALPAFFLTLTLLGASETHAQKATAVAKGQADLNGDGRPDELRIDEMGNITAHITGQDQTSAWTTLQAMGKVVDGSFQVSPERDGQGRSIIIVKTVLRSAQSKRREEGLVLAYEAGTFTELWRGRIGLAGSDGATTVSLELSPYGLIKYSNRHGVVRCDGETAHLDAERLDLKRGVFRPARQAVRIPADAPRLTTSEQLPAGLSAKDQGILFRPSGASSSIRAASSAELVAPLELSDGDYHSAWIENASGYGRGEFVTFKASIGKLGVKVLRLRLGHGAAHGDYDRPKRLGLALSKSERYWIEIPNDPNSEQWVVLPAAIRTDCVTLIIDEVYPGRKHKGQTAISEVGILSEEELSKAGPGKLLAEHIAKGRANADVERLLDRLGQSAAPALVAAITANTDLRAKLRLRLALARIPARADELVKALTEMSLSSAEEMTIAKGLETLADEGVEALIAALKSKALSDEAYQRLSKLLAASPSTAATPALFEALAIGSQERRSHIAGALAKRPGIIPALLAALAAAPSETLRAGLYQSLGVAGHALDPHAPEAQDLMRALATELGRGPTSYESRYRLIQACHSLGGALLGIGLLAEAGRLEAATEAEDLAIARLVTSALATMVPFDGEPTVTRSVEEYLLRALDHTDPGVRLAALSSLAGSTWAQAGIAKRLAADAWPEVRRSAAASLAQACGEHDSARALQEATRNDEDTGVSQTALASLVSCRMPGILVLLIDLLGDSKRPLDLRLQAARAMGSAASAAQTDLVHKEFKKARRRALSDVESGKIAAAMTVSLADLGDSKAVELLESAAADPAFPELQAAALTALGKLCPASSMKLLRTLKESQEHTVSSAARRAIQQCR